MPCSLSHRFIFDILASFNCLAYLSRTILLSLTKRKRSPILRVKTIIRSNLGENIMTMVDPVLVASQFDEDEAEAILRYNIRKYLKANRVSQNSLMDVLNITSGAVSQLMTGRTHFKYGHPPAIPSPHRRA